MAGEFAFEVVDSVVYMNLLGEEVSQTLRRGGKFKIEQQSAYAYESTVSSSTSLTRGGVTLVLSGKLGSSKPRGKLVERI
ncbi:MAG: hypothetical protein AAF499_14860, partial [Pseudomonadota bacterium]